MATTREAPRIDAVRPRLWTRAEYERLAEVGLLGEDDHVELIEGVIYEVAPQKSRGAVAIGLAHEALQRAFGHGHHVRVQLPLALGQSEPEPDVAVVPGVPRDYLTSHPTTALLVVEVSDTTLAYDREVKAEVYARAGVLDYWIDNLVDEQLEVYRDPGGLAAGRFGYRSRMLLPRGGSISPLARAEVSIAVADLLP